MRELRYIAVGGLILSLGIFFQRIAGFLSRIILSRTGTEQYGAFSFVFTFFMILSMLVPLGIDKGVTRFVSYYAGRKNDKGLHESMSTATMLVIPFSVLVAVLLWLLAPDIESLFKMQIAWMLRWFALALPFYTCAKLFLSIMQAYRKVSSFAFASAFSEGAVRLGIVMVLFIRGYGILAGVVGYSLSFMALFVAGLILLYQNRLPFLTSGKIRKELLVYSLPLMATSGIALLSESAGTMLLGIFKTAGKIALFNAAQPIACLLTLTSTILSPLIVPVMTTRHARNQRLSPICYAVAKWVILITLPIAVFFIIFSKQLLVVLFGNAYAGASGSLQVLTLAYLLITWLVTGNAVLFARGNSTKILIITFLGLIANVLVSILAVPKVGQFGASLAMLASAIIMALTMTCVLSRTSKIDFYRIADIRILIASAGAAIICIILLLLLNKGPLSLLLSVVIFFLVYILLILLFRVPDHNDKQVLRHLLSNILKLKTNAKSSKPEEFK